MHWAWDEGWSIIFARQGGGTATTSHAIYVNFTEERKHKFQTKYIHRHVKHTYTHTHSIDTHSSRTPKQINKYTPTHLWWISVCYASHFSQLHECQSWKPNVEAYFAAMKPFVSMLLHSLCVYREVSISAAQSLDSPFDGIISTAWLCI